MFATRLFHRTLVSTARICSTTYFHSICSPTLPITLSILPYQRIIAPSLTITRTMASKRHKKMIKRAKGYFGRANRCFTVAKQRVTKAMQNMYIGRKLKKRTMRKLWITRMNAGSRMYGLSYSNFIHGLLKANVKVNRKVLADLAITEPLSFRAAIEISKKSIQRKVTSSASA